MVLCVTVGICERLWRAVMVCTGMCESFIVSSAIVKSQKRKPAQG